MRNRLSGRRANTGEEVRLRCLRMTRLRRLRVHVRPLGSLMTLNSTRCLALGKSDQRCSAVAGKVIPYACVKQMPWNAIRRSAIAGNAWNGLAILFDASGPRRRNAGLR